MPSSGTWETSSLGRTRAAVGDDLPLFLVGTRMVIRDEQGRVLLIQRSDNGLWAFPAGSIEIGETLAAGAVREAYEETGLVVTAATPFGTQSDPGALERNMYGHVYHLVITAFRADAWEGELERVTDETTDAGFYEVGSWPSPLASSVEPLLADLAAFEADGRFVLR